jgi:hypothetical protein
MLVFSMNEQSMQVTGETDVQKPGKSLKKRSHLEKIGRLKYNQMLLKRVLDEVKEIKEIQGVILNGLKGAGYFHFSLPLIERLSCIDQADLEILDLVHTSGVEGIYPKDVAALLPSYKLKQYHVTRRIQRMNKRLEHRAHERLFEKRGYKWALTRFGFDSWGETERKDNGETS